MAQKHFSMTAKQLCAVGDKACKAELKRRGRDSSGKKIVKRQDLLILRDLLRVECDLSPREGWDGRSVRLARAEERRLLTKKRALTTELGRTPTATEMWGLGDLGASGDKACKAELKRRGSDSSGKKLGSKVKKSESSVSMTRPKKPSSKSAKVAASSYLKKWAGFPMLVGGMEGSSLLDPQYGYSVYGGDLSYDDMDQVGSSGWGIEVKKKGSKYTITGSGSLPYAGGDSQERLLSGASRAEAIRYLKWISDYHGPE